MVLRTKKKFWSKEIVERAKQLRKANLTYSQISNKLGVAKSTLSSWIKDIKRDGYLSRQDKLLHLERIRILATKEIKREREERLRVIKLRVRKEVSSYNTRNSDFKKAMLSMLYWAEGSKGRGTIQFANTDHKLALLFIHNFV